MLLFTVLLLARLLNVGGTQVNIASFTCHLSDLIAFAGSDEPATILRHDKPWSLRLTVAFGGSGAIALMPLEMTLRADFFAKVVGVGASIELGSSTVKTQSDQYSYILSLKSKHVAKTELQPDKVYNIGALVRVGAPTHPALINGLIDDLMVEIY